VIEDGTKQVLEKCPDAEVVVNLSLDGVGKEHDTIRGVPGNFGRFTDTYERLKRLKGEYSNFNVSVHTVVSNFNVGKLAEIYDYVTRLRPDSFICEVAEKD
jgi:sulfatase maturation enzyme AslB (radical SAM superfamily)